MEPKKKVGVWVRVSTEFQVLGDSPEHHELRARHYAEAKGWEVAEVYRLEAISGKTVKDLPDTKRMMADIKSGKISALIFSNLTRLARNTRELLEFSEFFDAQGADLVSLSQSIDTSSPTGKLFFTIAAAFAEFERSEIAARVAASVPIRAQLGKPLGGAAAYGFKWDKKNKALLVDDIEAPVRRLMYELFTEYKRVKTVANELNKRGYRTRNGSNFTNTTIGRLLRDTTAKGIRIANHTKSRGEGKGWQEKPVSDWVMVPCPAIVEESLWDECNRILDKQEKKERKPAKRAVYLFTGLLYCECGGKMILPNKGTKYRCSDCRKNAIGKDDLEEIYHGHLKSFLPTGEVEERFKANANFAIRSKEMELQTLEAEKKKVMAEKDKLMQLYMSGEIPKEGFGNYYNPLDRQLKEIERSIPQTQAEIDVMKIECMNSDTVIEEAKSLIENWTIMGQPDKRHIIEQITDRITLKSDEIQFRFAYNPSYAGNTPERERNLTDS